MGNARALYTDDNVTFSFYQGPKRTAPLFSLSARDSFLSFCERRRAAAHGRAANGKLANGTDSHAPSDSASPGCSDCCASLPADRAEFNDDDATVALPSHVRFVPLGDAVTWGLWEDWVLDSWFQ
jgi:hypothetical protein